MQHAVMEDAGWALSRGGNDLIRTRTSENHAARSQRRLRGRRSLLRAHSRSSFRRRRSLTRVRFLRLHLDKCLVPLKQYEEDKLLHEYWQIKMMVQRLLQQDLAKIDCVSQALRNLMATTQTSYKLESNHLFAGQKQCFQA